MSTLATTHPTMHDYAKSLDPKGNIAPVVEVLNEMNPILEDAYLMEGNLPTGHRSIVRTGIPSSTWRKMYGYVQPNRATQEQVTDNCGMLTQYAEIDIEQAKLGGNPAKYRAQQERAHIEGMAQDFATGFFYATETTAPESITGLAPRFNSTSAENGCNIITGGGSDPGGHSSVWLVGHGMDKCQLIYPKGSKAGLEVQDLGQQTVSSSSGYFEAYRTYFVWKVGVSVPDWRYVVRIPNIDVSGLTKNASSGADLIDLMTQAIDLLPSLQGCRPVFYCSRTVKTALRRQMANKIASSTLTMEMVAGKSQMTLDGIPVKRCDAILNTEGTIS